MPLPFSTTALPTAVPEDGGGVATTQNRLPKKFRFLPLLVLSLFLALCWPATKTHGVEEKPDITSASAAKIKLLLDKDYFPTLLEAIKNAKSEIEVAMFLFKTTPSAKNRPAMVLETLAAARKRGVKVEVILEKSAYDDDLNRENKHAARLLKNRGIPVRYDRGNRTAHTKLVVIDRRYSFIGSHNLTHAALGINHEASLLVDNRALAEKLLRYIQRL